MLASLSERGQGIIEYALLLILIAMVVILALNMLGVSLGDIYSNIITNVRGI